MKLAFITMNFIAAKVEKYFHKMKGFVIILVVKLDNYSIILLLKEENKKNFRLPQLLSTVRLVSNILKRI